MVRLDTCSPTENLTAGTHFVCVCVYTFSVTCWGTISGNNVDRFENITPQGNQALTSKHL